MRRWRKACRRPGAAVAPTLLGVFLGMAGPRAVGEGFLYFGLVLAYLATGLYVQDGLRQLRLTAGPPHPPRPDDPPLAADPTSVD